MQKKKNKAPNRNRGFALLIAVLVSGIILAIGFAILNITLKEFLLSNIARESEIAFYAADAGVECALYWNEVERNAFVNGTDIACLDGGSMSIQNPGAPGVGETITNEFEWTWQNQGGQPLCTKLTVEKLDCNLRNPAAPPGLFICTTITGRGYNKACADLDDDRTVERAIEVLF